MNTPLTMKSGQALRQRSGQAMIFVILVVVILSFVALFNFDLHKVIYVKSLSQNAGDASALAGARWQAITLNLIGDLNVMQAVALTQGDTNQASDINDLQARLCYVGPMIGVEAAQQAAKNNGIYNNDRFAAILEQHANDVLNVYPMIGSNGRMMFPEPYPGCWKEYAAMIETIALHGVAVAPDNARLYSDISGGHMLLNPDFYDAVAGSEWCWFYHHAYSLLQTYVDFHSWPPLPQVIPQPDPINCEYFGLGLIKRDLIGDARAVDMMNQARDERGLSPVVIDSTVGGMISSWYSYDPAWWGTWDALSPYGNDPFPVTGLVKSQYDYTGADAVTRVLSEASRLTPGSNPNRSFLNWNQNTATSPPISSPITWTAAAKPFGYLEVNGQMIRPNEYGLVIPAFRDVRLIPIDASSGSSGGAFDLGWRDHVDNHLQGYMISGPTVNGCWYCQQLVTWENPIFRQTGIAWLSVNSASCQQRGGGGRPRDW
ncbi:MAG: Tad domain-containing protein, partial [bacterium]